MIDRRIFACLLALCPGFVQRAIAGPERASAEVDPIMFLRDLRTALFEQAENRRTLPILDRAIEDLDGVALRHQKASKPEWEAFVLEVVYDAFPGTRPVSKMDGAIRSFDNVRPGLRPQIFPTEYLEGEGGLLYRSLSPKSSVVIVETAVGMNRFVRAEEADAWGLDFTAAVAAAIENLEADSIDTGVSGKHLPGGGIVGMVGFGDGVDHSRALVPAFRRQLLSLAATPLQAAVPNRDMLMFWTPGVVPFEEIRSLVGEFYEEGPFSRTDEIFDLKAETFRPV